MTSSSKKLSEAADLARRRLRAAGGIGFHDASPHLVKRDEPNLAAWQVLGDGRVATPGCVVTLELGDGNSVGELSLTCKFWSNQATLRNVTGKYSNSQLYTSMPVCQYGRGNDADPSLFGQASCGSITHLSRSFTKNLPGHGWVTVSDMIGVGWWTGIRCPGGSSGGPLYLGGFAVGIQSGYEPSKNECFFSKIQNAETQFGVFVQIS